MVDQVAAALRFAEELNAALELELQTTAVPGTTIKRISFGADDTAAR